MRSTATVCVILACVGGALSTHSTDWATGHVRQYQALVSSPCGAFPITSFKVGATEINEIASKKYTTAGAKIGEVQTLTKGQLWDDIKEALLRLEQLDSHKETYGGGLGGWTPDQHAYVNWLSKAIAGVDETNMKISGVGSTKEQCQRLQVDLSTIYANIEKLSAADQTVTDHTDEQHTDSSVSVNKRPWHSVAAALTIAGLANTIQKY